MSPGRYEQLMRPLRFIPDGPTVLDITAHHHRAKEDSIADIFSLGKHSNFPSGEKIRQRAHTYSSNMMIKRTPYNAGIFSNIADRDRRPLLRWEVFVQLRWGKMQSTCETTVSSDV